MLKLVESGESKATDLEEKDGTDVWLIEGCLFKVSKGSKNFYNREGPCL